MLKRIVSALGLLGTACSNTPAFSGTFPDPPQSKLAMPGAAQETAVLAGGCFWGVELVFQNLKGVSQAVSGYAGGSKKSAHYEMVSDGNTGHAEAVQVTFDPSKISYGQLLKVFFSVAHDPTQKNRQGPDVGTQYRSAIFYTNSSQKEIAEAYIRELNNAHIFSKPIATEVVALPEFFTAETYHQKFAEKNPGHPYIAAHDLPKLRNLKGQYPEMVK
jgi:peptide-methionine (S)-S-oxide reductase